MRLNTAGRVLTTHEWGALKTMAQFNEGMLDVADAERAGRELDSTRRLWRGVSRSRLRFARTFL